MDLGVSGRLAVVMGVTGGLGGACARALAQEGATVIACGRDADRTGAFVQTLTQAGLTADPLVLDLAEPASVASAVGHLAGQPVDILVNNSGGPPPGTTAAITPEVLDAQFQAMVASLIQITNALVPGMRQRGWGRVLTIASSGTQQPIPNLALSNTLRAALVGFTKTLATEVAADGVTANMLLPGRIDTDRVARLDAAAAQRQGITAEEARAQAIGRIPARRLGTPAEFGATAAFLCSQPAAYITGSQIRVDGGLVATV